MLAVVIGCSGALAAAAYGLGHVVAAEISGTVVVDNPAYPGDPFCNGHHPEEFEPSGCDEPATLERDASALAVEAFRDAAVHVAGAFLVAWLLGTVVLHGAAWFAGGDGTLLDTAEISAWSGVAVTVTATASLAAGAVAVRTQGLDGDDAEAIATSILAVVEGLESIFFVLAVVGVSWQALVWFAGLTERHGIDDGRAGVVAGLLWLLSVLGAA